MLQEHDLIPIHADNVSFGRRFDRYKVFLSGSNFHFEYKRTCARAPARQVLGPRATLAAMRADGLAAPIFLLDDIATVAISGHVLRRHPTKPSIASR